MAGMHLGATGFGSKESQLCNNEEALPVLVPSQWVFARSQGGEDLVRVREHGRSLVDDTHRSTGLEEQAPAEPMSRVPLTMMFLCLSPSSFTNYTHISTHGVLKATTMKWQSTHTYCAYVNKYIWDSVSGYWYMIGQENNLSKTCSFTYGRTRVFASKSFVLSPGTRMIL